MPRPARRTPGKPGDRRGSATRTDRDQGNAQDTDAGDRRGGDQRDAETGEAGSRRPARMTVWAITRGRRRPLVSSFRADATVGMLRVWPVRQAATVTFRSAIRAAPP